MYVNGDLFTVYLTNVTMAFPVRGRCPQHPWGVVYLAGALSALHYDFIKRETLGGFRDGI